MFEFRLALELTLNHPPLKGRGTKESSLISMFPLPSWERARVRGDLYLELPSEKLLAQTFTCLPRR